MRRQLERQGDRVSRRWWVVVVAFGFLLGACAEPTATSTVSEPTQRPTEVATDATESAQPTEEAVGERTFDAGYGEVTIDGIPERVYAWGLQAVDTLAVLGVEPVAFTGRGDSGLPEYLGVEWDAEQLGDPPSLEQVVALEPDFILADESRDVEPLLDIAPVLRIRANSYTDAMDQLLIVAEIFDKEEVAQAFVDDFETELETTQEQIRDEDPVSSMVIYPGAEPGVLGMWLDTSFTGSLVDALGTTYALQAAELGESDLAGDNADFAARAGLVQLGLEKVIDIDPDVLFLLGNEEFVASLEENPAWSTLSAVQNERVYTFDRNIWSRVRGPLAALVMLQQGRNALFPEIFPDAPQF